MILKMYIIWFIFFSVFKKGLNMMMLKWGFILIYINVNILKYLVIYRKWKDSVILFREILKYYNFISSLEL